MSNEFKINTITYQIDNPLDDNSFVGIRIINREFHVTFPIGYKHNENNNDEENRKELMDLYKTIAIAKSLTMENDNKESDTYEIPINSYIWILKDYFSNGIFKEYDRKYKNDIKGKINWKRTFQNSSFISNNKPIYLNTVIEYKNIEENIITKLQLYCICKSMDVLGFLGKFSKPRSELNDKNIKDNINEYNSILDNKIKNTYNDRQKIMLNNIKNIINDNATDTKKIRSYGTSEYHYAWEKMIDKVFGSKDINIKEFYPHANWTLMDDYRNKKASNMREDTIFKDNKSIYIIDSKYYKYGSTLDDKDLPNTDSIHKQVVYGEHVKHMHNYKEYDVYNVFVIPSNNNDFVEYKGFAEMEHTKESNNKKSYERVYLFLVNIKDIIKKYLGQNDEKSDINDLVKLIKEHEKD